MRTSGRVPVLVLGMIAILALSACDPKDFFGPEEGIPQPPDETFFPRTDPSPISASDEMNAAVLSPANESETSIP